MAHKDPREALAQLQRQATKRPTESELPPTTKIKIDVVGTRGKRYAHTFTYTVPTIGQQIDIGKLKTFYLPQGSAADGAAGALVEQIAYLTVTIDPESLPDWWVPMEMRDATPIGALYEEALGYERRFHGAKSEDDDHGVGEGSGEEAEDVGGESEAPDAGVGDGAQPPAKRRKTLSSSRG